MATANADSDNRPARAGKGEYALSLKLRIAKALGRFRLRQVVGDSAVVLTGEGLELRRLSDLIAYLSRVSGVSTRAIWRWYSIFTREGQPGLIRKHRSDRGSSRSLDSRGLAVLFILDKRADNWRASVIHRALATIWPRLYRDGSRAPSYATLRRFLPKVCS